VLVVGAIVFVLSPADIIPHMIPVLGELDDLFHSSRWRCSTSSPTRMSRSWRDHWPGDPEELTH